MAGTAIIWANVAAQVVNRVGVKPALIFGMVMMTIGLLYFTRVSVGGSYLGDLLPGFLIIGCGMPFCFIPITIASLAGTKPEQAGLASGLINTSQQIGGALGIAVLSTVATAGLHAGVRPTYAQLTHGFQNAFWVGAAVSAVGVVVSVLLVRGSDVAAQFVPAGEVA